MSSVAAGLYAAGAILLTVSLAPISRNPHWLIRGLDFPRLQFCVLGALLLAAEFFLLDRHTVQTWALVAVTTLCLLWHCWWILPYTPLWRKEVRDADLDASPTRLSILTSNVLATNRNVHTLLALVRDRQPDVLVTLESDAWWEEALNALESTMPYTIKCPLDNLYGMHVYSRLPIHESAIEYLVEDDVPSMHASLELTDGTRVRAHFLHPAPPSPTENTESAERDAELVIVAQSVAAQTGPVVVTGDLNDVAWSATTRLFRKLSGLLDPRVGRGMYNTFHAHYPPLRWPLDHLFHSNHFHLVSIERLPAIGSDHFALLTVLALSAHGEPDQNGLSAGDDDHALAQEIATNMQASREDVPAPGRR